MKQDLDKTIRIPVITELVRAGDPAIVNQARNPQARQQRKALFEQRLKERSAGRVKSVVFIEGGRHPDTGLTHTEHLLTFSNGGVKCYVSEQPAEAVMAQAV